LSDANRFETVDSDKKGTSSDVHLVRHAANNTQNVDEQIILLLSQVPWVGMLGATLDYLAQIGPPAITIEVYETRMIGHGYLSCKRLTTNGEAVGHPWLLFLARKNIIFCHYCKLFSSGYAL